MVGQPYTVTPCECGHTEALHASARTSWPHPPQYGVCLVAGCDCEAFTPTSSRKEPHEVSEDHPDGHRPVRSDVAAGRGGSPVVVERQPLALTRVRALTMGLTLGSALGALTVLLAQAVTS